MKNYNSNYTTLQIILVIAHFISPLVLLLFIGDYLPDGSFLSKLAFNSFAMFFLIGIFTAGSTTKIKTGKSFKTKSGVHLDEYKDKYTPGFQISSLHSSIGLIHLFFAIIVLVYNFIQFSNQNG